MRLLEIIFSFDKILICLPVIVDEKFLFENEYEFFFVFDCIFIDIPMFVMASLDSFEKLALSTDDVLF